MLFKGSQLLVRCSQNPGLNSGLMCWELTACALDAENRTLSMPASAESNVTGASHNYALIIIMINHDVKK